MLLLQFFQPLGKSIGECKNMTTLILKYSTPQVDHNNMTIIAQALYGQRVPFTSFKMILKSKFLNFELCQLVGRSNSWSNGWSIS